MACSKYTLTNTGSTAVNFNYRRCDDSMWEYQVNLNPGQTKNIWLVNGTYDAAQFFDPSISLVNDGAFPPQTSPYSNCVSFTVNTVGGTGFTIDTITMSALNDYTITWGDGETTTGSTDGSTGVTHNYPLTGRTYNGKICFGDASLVTDFRILGGDAVLTSITNLKNLTNVTYLNFTGQWLTSLNVSGLVNLVYLRADGQTIPGTSTRTLASLNVSGCSSLETLRVNDNNFSSGFPNLSGLNSLSFIDFNECQLTGPIDLSILPSLGRVNFDSNTSLSAVTISSSQPLGSNGDVVFYNCNLTQTSVNNILVALSENGIVDGFADLSGGTNAVPGTAGANAITVLEGNGWTVSVNS